MTPHEVLGVAPDATPDELRSAYRHLVRELHPDTRAADVDGAAADEALRRVQWAYDTLTGHRDHPTPRSVRWNDATTSENVPFHRTKRFPWWIVAIAVMMAIFIITAYAGSVPVSTP